jgi:Uma2 family endonuclease
MGTEEYWIVDFRALGAVRYIGQPKQPTVTICHLHQGEYQLLRLVAGQAIASRILPDLRLSTDAIFQSAYPSGSPTQAE